MRLFDAAYKPDLSAVKAAGGAVMSVYLTGNYADTCAQPSELHTFGLGALGNYEQAAGELLTCGQSGGVAIGQRAAQAYIGKGAPAGRGLGIAFSVDVNCPPSAFAAVGAAFDGIRQGVAGRFVAFIYGEGALIDYLVANHGMPRVGWLSASSSFPGFNRSDPDVALVQEVGSPVAGTDLDTVTQEAALDPLIWWPAGAEHTLGSGTPLTAPTAQEADMTPAESQTLTDVRNDVKDVHGRLAKIDDLFFALNNSILPALGDIRTKVGALYSRPDGTVDVHALAADLAKQLGPDMGKQLVVALETALAPAAGATG